MNLKGNGSLAGTLAVSWIGAAANFAAEAKSIFGALAALASLIASCYAIAIARRRLKLGGSLTTDCTDSRKGKKGRKGRQGTKGTKGTKVMMAALLLCAVLSQGCTHQAKKWQRANGRLEKQQLKMEEESRALTTGVVDALQLAPPGPETDLARSLAVADQEVEGLPLNRLPVMAALGGDTNAATVIDERVAVLVALRLENARLREVARGTEEKLMEMGAVYEAERNRKIWWRSKWSMGLLGLLGGGVALFVFCPVALPVVGRLLGWVVGRMPALAGTVGVVGKDAFDAVIKGVGQARSEYKKGGSANLATLDTHLRIETDAAHKELIERRRAALGV